MQVDLLLEARPGRKALEVPCNSTCPVSDGLHVLFDGLLTDQTFGVLPRSFCFPAVGEEVGAGPLCVRMPDADGRLWLRHDVK